MEPNEQNQASDIVHDPRDQEKCKTTEESKQTIINIESKHF